MNCTSFTANERLSSDAELYTEPTSFDGAAAVICLVSKKTGENMAIADLTKDEVLDLIRQLTKIIQLSC